MFKAKRDKGRVRIKSGVFSWFNKRKNKEQGIESLQKALAIEADCSGCGIECECFGYLTLPNWNSSTGSREDGWAVAIIDGVVVVNTKENIEDQINTIKNI